MARPVWTGTIAFGMVAIPIRLIPAVKRQSISFNQLDERDMARIRYRKVNEITGDEVPSEHIVKGFDTGGSNYVVITDDDLAPLMPKKSKTIELESFVPLTDVNPLMFDSSYLALPDQHAKPYALLAEALADSGRIGVGRFVMRQKEYLAAVRSDGEYLTLSTLVFPEELVDPAAVDEFEQLDGVEVSSKELQMAKGLVEAMSDDFRPDEYHDEYRSGVEEVIAAKAAGTVFTPAADTETRGEVIDLAAALEASLAEARKARERHPAGDSSTAKRGAKATGTKVPAGTRTAADADTAAAKRPAKRKSA